MKKLNIHLYSIHGLIRSYNLELGRDADTGGQTKYLVEFARALGEHPEVGQVNLFTRQIFDKRVSTDYARELEPLSEKARIVRIKAGPKRYLRKELLWPYLDEFVDNSLRFMQDHAAMPDLVHGHYADAAYVASELAGYLGVPFVFTGHSLGRNKLQVLKNAGLDEEAIETQYHISQRIEIEEEALRKADIVIASTQHEVKRGYELYNASSGTDFKVIPPGINVDTFYPYYYDLDTAFEPEEEIIKARVRMQREISRFLLDPKKPLILAVSRPDRRKNIDGLVTAYGEDKELQAIANLAIFAGVRSDIQAMDDNEKDVLTQMLLLMDKYDLYGKMALPKKHQPDTDIPVLYRLAAASKGVFVNPALVENFGITLIEASSSGLPIVSTDHGGPQDIIANCDSGILIDAQNTSSIQNALKAILVDSERWETYSANGINGVRKHYAWKAHAETYLQTAEKLIDQDSITDASWRSKIGQHLTKVEKVLISDIDYTLIHQGREAEKALEPLKLALANAQIGFGVATGRSLELVKDVLETYDLPQPDIVVCAVGSEIYYGKTFMPDHGYARHISYSWKPEHIKDVLKGLSFLDLQEAENQKPFKLSYYMAANPDHLAKVHERLSHKKLRYNLIYSHGQFLDILPHRASKGKAIRYLSHKWGIAADNIAVAGDSGNDEEMLRGNFKGIVVGNYAQELEVLKGKNRIYFADGHYAAGVMEGLEHYNFI